MKLKEQYQINDLVWMRLKTVYYKGVLFGSFFIALGFTFIIWAYGWTLLDDMRWGLIPVIPWVILYIFFLYNFRAFFIYARRTHLVMFLNMVLFTFDFGVVGVSFSYFLIGMFGFIAHILVYIIAASILFIRGFRQVDIYWNKNLTFNEMRVLDLDEGRYDYSTDFKLGNKGESVLVFCILLAVAPFSVGIGIFFSKMGYIQIILILGTILFSYVSLGFINSLSQSFYIYRKIIYFEKQIKKPIINGLLDN